MPLKIVFSKPQTWSRLKPDHQNIITAIKGKEIAPKLGEKKTDKGKSQKGIWRSDAPEASQGQTRDVPGTPGTFGPDLCVNQY